MRRNRQKYGRFVSVRKTFITSTALAVKTLDAMQQAFDHKLEIIRLRDGCLIIVPPAISYDRFCDFLLASGMNAQFVEQKLSPEYM